MRPIELDLARSDIQHNGGKAYTIRLPRKVDTGDNSEDGAVSDLQLFEDGSALGPAHTGHDEIREEGGGRYCHWQDTLYFSTSDGSDPRENGRTYSIRGVRKLDTAAAPAAAPQSAPVRCPCCGFSGHLKPYAKRNDFDGQPVNIDICTFCTAIVNRTELERALADTEASLEKQEGWSHDYYTTNLTDQEIADQIVAYRHTIQALLNEARQPVARSRSIDLGAGLGYLAAGAAEYFDEAWAVEINPRTLRSMLQRMNLRRPFKVGAGLDDVPGQATLITAWHSLEHMPELYKIGMEVAAKLAPDGAFYWQVPMYRDDYVVASHYTFMNETSARIFCERIGLEMQDVWFDLELQFLTVVARKPAARLAAA